MARFDLLLRAFARRSEVFAQLPDLLLPASNPNGEGPFAEPVADSAAIRDYPHADIAAVDAWSDSQALQLRIRTLQPASSRVTFRAIIHVVNPAPGDTRVLQVQCRYGQPSQVWTADDRNGPALVPMLANYAVCSPEAVSIAIPHSYLGNGRQLMVDVTTQAGRATVDHSVTRLLVPAVVGLPATPAPTPAPPGAFLGTR